MTTTTNTLLDLEDEGKMIRKQLFDLKGEKGPLCESTDIPEGFYSHSKLHTQQCRYSKGCSNQASLYADLCSDHAVGVYGCEIKQSTIRDAGLGLFSTQNFDEGDLIDLYEGERYANDEDTQNAFLPFGFLMKEGNYVIDSKSTQSCVSRYINNNPAKSNCRFVKFSPHPDVTFVAVTTTRPVSVGEEFFLDYGEQYKEYK
jgi:hypothetical protein